MASADLRDELTCCVCMDIYTDPVTLTCGHSYCRLCITRRWDNQEKGESSCAVCLHRFRVRPELKRALTLCNIAETFRSTHPEQEEQEEVGIPCTYCDSPVPAAKTCLHCEASLCEKHLQKHSKSAEHVLTEPTTSLENRKCSVHKKVLPDVNTASDMLPDVSTASTKLPGVNTASTKLPGVNTASTKLPGVNTALDMLLDLNETSNDASVSEYSITDAEETDDYEDGTGHDEYNDWSDDTYIDGSNDGDEDTYIDGYNDGDEDTSIDGSNDGDEDTYIDGYNDGDEDTSIDGHNDGDEDTSIDGHNDGDEDTSTDGHNDGDEGTYIDGYNDGDEDTSIDGSNDFDAEDYEI